MFVAGKPRFGRAGRSFDRLRLRRASSVAPLVIWNLSSVPSVVSCSDNLVASNGRANPLTRAALWRVTLSQGLALSRSGEREIDHVKPAKETGEDGPQDGVIAVP